LDQGPTPGKATACVLELDALYLLSEASGLVHRPRDSVLRELSKSIESLSLLSTPYFVYGVFGELSKVIEGCRPCQPHIFKVSSRYIVETGATSDPHLAGDAFAFHLNAGRVPHYSANLSKHPNDRMRSWSTKLL
jgi:hypothetical protein